MKPVQQQEPTATSAPSRSQLLSAPIRKEVERVLTLMDAASATAKGSPEFIHRGRALLLQLPAELDDQITAEVHRRSQSEVSSPSVPISDMLTEERLSYYIREMRGEPGAEQFIRFCNHYRKSVGFRRRPSRTSLCVELIAQALSTLPAPPHQITLADTAPTKQWPSSSGAAAQLNKLLKNSANK